MARICAIIFILLSGCSYTGKGCLLETPEFTLNQSGDHLIINMKNPELQYKLNKDCFCQKDSPILNTAVAGLALTADLLEVTR